MTNNTSLVSGSTDNAGPENTRPTKCMIKFGLSLESKTLNNILNIISYIIYYTKIVHCIVYFVIAIRIQAILNFKC